MAKEKKHSSEKKKKAHKSSSHKSKKSLKSSDEDRKKKKKEDKKKKKHHKETKEKKKAKPGLEKRISDESRAVGTSDQGIGNVTEEITRDDFFRLSEEFRVWLKLYKNRFLGGSLYNYIYI